MIIGRDLIKEYNKTRKWYRTGHLCHAPFINLNFEQNGNVTACCYNRDIVFGSYPKNTLHEMWFGEKIKELRTYIDQNNLGGGCKLCGLQLQAKNYFGTKAKYYDLPNQSFTDRMLEWAKIKAPIYPQMMEFELSNVCNLECTMCNGYFSSSIRKNREKLPELKMVYDDAFVDQLEEFIPHLTDAKFLGGEPFMVDIYYKIWDRIKAINPKVKVHITSNCTVLNGRIKDFVNSVHVHLVVSIDSLVKETYESIRVNANFDRVYSNLMYFLSVAKEKQRGMTFAVCPMKSNVYEIPDMLKFCNENDIALCFNTVWTPLSVSLRTLSNTELTTLIQFLEERKPVYSPKEIEDFNYQNYLGLISQLKEWLREKIEYLNSNQSVQVVHIYNSIKQESSDSVEQVIGKKLLKFLIETHVKSNQHLLNNKEILTVSGEVAADLLEAVNSLTDAPTKLRSIRNEFGGDFLSIYFDALTEYNKLLKITSTEAIITQKQLFLNAISDKTDIEKLLTDITNTDPDYMIKSIKEYSQEQVIDILSTRYELSTLS